MKSIYLCGFMGCGKSTVGKELSKLLDMDFYDLDDYIVQKEGRTIPEIFAQSSEAYFRKAEAQAICELSSCVVATGGGALINDNTAAFAKENGTVIFLDVPFEICYERIKDDKNRPLAVNNTKEQLRELFEKRREIYMKNSQLIAKTADKNAQNAAKEIALAIAERTDNADL